MSRIRIVRRGLLAGLALAAAAGCRDATGPGRAGEPWGILVVAGNGQEGAVRGALDDSVAVRVLDVHRRPVAGVEVRWTVEEGGGSAIPETSLTDAGGLARAAWTMGPDSGAAVLRATAAGRLRTQVLARARPRLELTITAPQPDAIMNDVLHVRARVVERATVVDSVVATAPGIRMHLVRGSEWMGGAPLGLLPAGAAEVRVTAYASTGDTATATMPFRRIPSLSLRVLRPSNYTVYSAAAVTVWATCITNVGSCTLDVRTPSSTTPVLQGAGEIRGTLSLSAADCTAGEPCPLTFTARDAAGLTVTEVRSVRVGVPAGVTEIASAGTQALDVDADRILYVDANRAPRVIALRDRSSGQETVITTLPDGPVPWGGWLHPQGAVFILQTQYHELHMYDWRAGRLEWLGAAWDSPGGFVVRGRWTVRNLRDGTVIRRDLYTGQDLLVAEKGTGSVAPNGDVAYITRSASGTSDEVYRLRDGVRTLLATCPVAERAAGCTLPVTDGSRVLYQVLSYGRMFGYYDLNVVVGNGPPERLGDGTATAPWVVYTADGWIVFHSGDYSMAAGFITPDGTRRLFDLQSPRYVLRFMSALGAGGVVVSEGTVYRPEYTQPGVTIPVAGRAEFRGGELLLFAGPTVYRVSY